MTNWKKPKLTLVTELSPPDEVFIPADAGDQFGADLAALSDQYDAAMSGYRWSDHVEIDPGPDVPLSLEQAVCLPELGGTLRVHIKASVASSLYTVKALRKAIDKGLLDAFFRDGKNLVTTRAKIKEWLEACAKSTKVPSSVADRLDMTNTASSPTAAPSSSTTSDRAQDKLRQDAVSAMISSMHRPRKTRS